MFNFFNKSQKNKKIKRKNKTRNKKEKNKNKTMNKKEKNKNKTMNKKEKNKNKKYIEGPCYMYFYPNLNNDRKLLIFGENHNNPNICAKQKKGIKILNFLKQIAENDEECVDIYIETFYKTKQFTRYDLNYELQSMYGNIHEYTSLDSLRDNFRNCDDRNKLFCNYKNSRIHFSDPRIIMKTNVIDITGTIDKYIKNVREGNVIVSPELHLLITNLSSFCFMNDTTYPKYKDALKFLMGWKKDDKHKKYYSEYLVSISGNNMDSFIDYYCKEYFKILEKEKNKIKYFSVEQIYKTLHEVYCNNYDEKIENSYSISLCIPMDVYFIFRYLMNFKKSKMSRGPSGCRETNYSKNTIIYCGYTHAKTYRDFFNKFFKTTAEINIEQNEKGNINSCLELPNNFEFIQ
jgi:hypothetical protein